MEDATHLFSFDALHRKVNQALVAEGLRPLSTLELAVVGSTMAEYMMQFHAIADLEKMFFNS